MNNNLPRVHDTGQMEFFPRTVNEACGQVGIQLWTMSQLHKAGLISFDPEGKPELTASQYAELCFVGALVAANCSPSTLTNLLCQLLFLGSMIRQGPRYRVNQPIIRIFLAQINSVTAMLPN